MGGFWALPTTLGTAYPLSSSNLSDQIRPKFDEESIRANFEALCLLLLLLEPVRLSAGAAWVGVLGASDNLWHSLPSM